MYNKHTDICVTIPTYIYISTYTYIYIHIQMYVSDILLKVAQPDLDGSCSHPAEVYRLLRARRVLGRRLPRQRGRSREPRSFAGLLVPPGEPNMA